MRPGSWIVALGFTLASATGTSARLDDAAIPPDLPDLVLRAASGQPVSLRPPTGGATVLVFTSIECPIANYYSATLNGLVERFGADRVRWIGVGVDPDASLSSLDAYAKEYHLAFPLASDVSGTLARRLGVSVTPECVVIDGQGAVAYQGRIDDQYADRQVKTANPQTHELADAVEAVLAGRPVAVARTEAVGCPLPVADASADSRAREVTYSRDVAPILYQHCTECHRPGKIGPFPLLTFEQARKRAADLADVTEQRLMPPWRARPGSGPAFAHDRSLSTAELKTLAAWADAGAPEGNPADRPPVPTFDDGWQIGAPDLVLEIPEAYDVPATGDDIYRCFVIPTSLGRDVFIADVEYQPGNPRVVHHVLGYVDTSGQAMKRDEAEAGPGYTSFSGPGIERIHGDLGGWAPGAGPSRLPEGIGRSLPDGAHIVLQVHYHPNGKPEQDRTRIALKLAKGPVRQAFHWTWVLQPELKIPAGEPNFEVTALRPLPVDALAFAVTPHMHMLGKDMTIWAERPDGTRVDLIEVDRWNFGWQLQYAFEKPVRLPRGTVLKLIAHFDNSSANPHNPSSPPQEVTWGEATTDEMCIGFLGLVRDGQDLTRPGEKDDLQEILLEQEQGRRRHRGD